MFARWNEKFRLKRLRSRMNSFCKHLWGETVCSVENLCKTEKIVSVAYICETELIVPSQTCATKTFHLASVCNGTNSFVLKTFVTELFVLSRKRLDGIYLLRLANFCDRTNNSVLQTFAMEQIVSSYKHLRDGTIRSVTNVCKTGQIVSFANISKTEQIVPMQKFVMEQIVPSYKRLPQNYLLCCKSLRRNLFILSRIRLYDRTISSVVNTCKMEHFRRKHLQQNE